MGARRAQGVTAVTPCAALFPIIRAPPTRGEPAAYSGAAALVVECACAPRNCPGPPPYCDAAADRGARLLRPVGTKGGTDHDGLCAGVRSAPGTAGAGLRRCNGPRCGGVGRIWTAPARTAATGCIPTGATDAGKAAGCRVNESRSRRRSTMGRVLHAAGVRRTVGGSFAFRHESDSSSSPQVTWGGLRHIVMMERRVRSIWSSGTSGTR